MEKEILALFLYNEKLKFNEIEKCLKVRSNKIAYHLKNLIKKEILLKSGNSYKLSKENLIPYLSAKRHVLPIILIYIGNGRECFLAERDKKPFKNFMGMPGGRIILGENLNEAVERIMYEKHKITAKLKKINSVSIEHIKNSRGIFQTDLIIFATATTKNKIYLTNIKENKSRIISSDYKLIKNHLGKETKIERFITVND